MSLKLASSFTGTPNAWNQVQRVFNFDFDVKKCPYLTDKSIIHLDDYFSSQDISKRVKTTQWPRIQKLGHWLNEFYSNSVDPIEFILYLYYVEQLSAEDVLSRCRDFWFPNKNQSWFCNFLTNTLKWELRDPHEMTDRRQKKISRKSNPSAIWLINATNTRIAEKIQIFNAALLEALQDDKESEEFSVETLAECKNKSDKVFYILRVFEWITIEILSQIYIDTWVWAGVIKNMLDEKLSVIYSENPNLEDLKLSVGMVHKLLNNKSKQ